MRIRLTREGIRFVVLLAVVAFAAYNTHNNLIFLMLSVGAATVAMALVSGFASLRALSVRAGEAPDAYAGSPFAERMELTNDSRFLHGFGIAVDEASSRVGVLRRGASALCPVTRLVPARGLHRGAPVRLATRFPFGLFQWERQVDVPRELLVFPEVRPVDPMALAVAGRGGAGLGGRPGRGDEFFRLRDYESGDAVHHIHWRTTAKVGSLIVRELGDAHEERLALTFQPSLAGGASGEDFERVVTATASIARHLADRGASFRFLSPDLDLPPRPGREHLRAVLAHLAVVRPVDGASSGWRARLERSRARGEAVLVVAADRGGLSGLEGGALRVLRPEEVLRGGGAP
jgi:uncharacterized protein (DUF58 family)